MPGLNILYSYLHTNKLQICKIAEVNPVLLFPVYFSGYFLGHDIEHDDVRKKGSGVLCDLSTKTAISMRVWPPVESSTLSSTDYRVELSR